MNYVEYDSNNSGGRWWLSDEDWQNLEKAGWEVQWYREQRMYGDGRPYKDGRFLGALASHAIRRGLSLSEAIREWEDITVQSSAALGCSCCGTPHHFTEYDDAGNQIASYSPDFPAYGDSYKDY